MGWAEAKIFFFFQNMVTLYIKLKGMKCTTTFYQIFLPNKTPSTPGMGSKGPKDFFSKSSHVAYQIKGNDEA